MISQTKNHSFFQTSEYKTYEKVGKILKTRHTLRNYIIFCKWRMNCMFLANEKFNKFGLDQENGVYTWDTVSEIEFGKFIPCYYSKLFKQNFLIMEDCVYFRNDLTGEKICYTKKELSIIKNKYKYELKKIHYLKSEFNGHLVYSNINKRNKYKKIRNRRLC